MIDANWNNPVAIVPEPQFNRSLERLAARIEWLPNGWHSAFGEMVVKLRATACKSRAHVVLIGRPLEPDSLNIGISVRDPTVEGILRKYSAKIACTCVQCGRRGKSAFVGGFQKVLCPTCLAPRLLHQELRKFTRLLAQHSGQTAENKVVGEQDIPPCLRLLIPETFWTKIQGARKEFQINCVTMQELDKLQPRLNGIKKYLEEMIEQDR